MSILATALSHPPLGGTASVTAASSGVASSSFDGFHMANPNVVLPRSGDEAEPSVIRMILDNLNVLQARMDMLTAPAGAQVQDVGIGDLPSDGVELAESLPVVPAYIADRASRGVYMDLRLLFPPNMGSLPRTRVTDNELERFAKSIPSVSSLASWLEAFAVYSALVGRIHPDKVILYGACHYCFSR